MVGRIEVLSSADSPGGSGGADERVLEAPSGSRGTGGSLPDLPDHRAVRSPHADNLIKAHAVVATVSLLVGGIAALLVLLTRWQAIHLLDAVWFYRILTVHGMNMLIFFIIFFEMAILFFAGPILLELPGAGAEDRLGRLRAHGRRRRARRVDDVDGQGGRAVHVLRAAEGDAELLPRRHPVRGRAPWSRSAIFFATLVVAKREKTYEGSVPLVTFGAITAAIIAVITLLHGAAIYIPTWLWSMGLMNVDPQIYRLVWWGLGHSSQQINVAAMVSIWYLLGDPDRGRRGAQREDQPHGLRALHPVHLHGVGAPPAGRSRHGRRVEDLEHQLLHVHGGAREHDPRLHGAGRHRDRDAPARLHRGPVRLAAQGAVG